MLLANQLIFGLLTIMAKRKEIQERQALSFDEKYVLAVKNGRELANTMGHRSISDKFPKDSVGKFLHARNHLKKVFDYYSRSDIQQAMFKYANGRKITYLRLFQPQYERLFSPNDILPLTINSLMEKGKYWPSLHGTVSRYGRSGGRICDVVLEIDYKANWKTCFEISRPIIDMLEDRGVYFKAKFSGHCSIHLIIPAEALMNQGLSIDHPEFFRRLSDLVKKKLRDPKYLDTSFYLHDHFLRLAYSVNENTGLVSLPFNIKDIDKFDPIQAEPEKVIPDINWWSFPKDISKQKDISERMHDFIQFVTKGHTKIASHKVDVELLPIPQVDRKLIQQAKQRKRQELREFLPNEGFYDRMIRLGQDLIDLREFLLLDDHDTKVALRTLRHLNRARQNIDIDGIAKKFGIDETDFRLLWKWEQNEPTLKYYSRDEISQIIHSIASGRKVRVGNEDKLVFLQEPVDIMPLIVYTHLISERAKDAFPAIRFTNSKYERTGEIPIACDIKIEFGVKGNDQSVIEVSRPIISLLSGFDISFLIYFDGISGLNIILPYESLPQEGKMASLRHETVLNRLTPLLKRSMQTPGASCSLIRDCDAISLMPYSIHPQTGLICSPLHVSDLRSFSAQNFRPEKIEVDNEWWDISDDAPIALAKFFKQTVIL